MISLCNALTQDLFDIVVNRDMGCRASGAIVS